MDEKKFQELTAYQGRPSPPTARQKRARFRFWYDNIIDWMLVNPDKPLTKCAEELKRGYATLLSVTNTDIFKARLAQRRQEYNNLLASEIATASGSVALLSLQEIQKRLRDTPEKIPIGTLVDTADKTLNRLGYGVAPVNNNTVNASVQIAVSPSALREAQDKMRQMQDANAKIIDQQAPERINRGLIPDLDAPIKISSN